LTSYPSFYRNWKLSVNLVIFSC